MNPKTKSDRRFLSARPLVALAAALLSAGPAAAQPVNDLWANKCASCHGTNAQGTTALSLTAASDWLGTNDRALYDALLEHDTLDDGSTGADLSAAQAWALINYTRELQEQARKTREPAPTPKAGGVFESTHHNYKLETVINSGLDTPWGVAWFEDGRMLITERSGSLRVLDDTKLSDPVRNTPAVRAQSQGGLLDVAVLLEPGNPDPWVYLSFADPQDRDGMTKVVRGKVRSAGRGALTWADEQTIWQADPDDYTGGGIHFGSRLVFDNQGHLFFTIGERGQGTHAQDLTRPNGKVHRVNLDGSIPDDNPFVGRDEGGSGGGVYESIWSYGHRNPQGLAIDSNGTLWDTEHGPRGGDEINIITKATNFGWPVISFGMNYNGTPLESPWPDVIGDDANAMALPNFRWLPSIAACGLDIGRGPQFPNWNNDLFAGGLAGQVLERLRFANGVITEREELLRGIGRVRDVVTGPDGAIYVVLNGPDKVVRLVNAD
ncbi:MAG: glucose/arabinose dehydrogenase [Phycisphaerales bacterium]|jgi:glucose/arabinose dehydrogenase